MFGFFAGRWRPLLYCVFTFYESNLTYVTVPFLLQSTLFFSEFTVDDIIIIICLIIIIFRHYEGSQEVEDS